MRSLADLAFTCLLSCCAIAQTDASRPRFDAVDIRPSTARFLRAGQLRDTRYDLMGATMLDLIARAYGIDAEKVLGGPSWLELNRYDMVALAPAKSTPEALNRMMQSMLADRFQLVIARENRDLPAYRLTAGKHQGLKEADPSGEPECKSAVLSTSKPSDDPGGRPLTMYELEITCKSMTMERFASEIRTLPFQTLPLRTRPIQDRTGLPGPWNFVLKYSQMQSGAPSPASVTLFDALDKQLGLKLEPVTLPQPVIVVKSVNEAPTPNSPEDLKASPPPPTEFEVAEIKPSDPAAPTYWTVVNGQILTLRLGRGPSLKNGRVDLPAASLKMLIAFAWDVHGDDAIAGLPKFGDTEKFDVIGKVPSGPSADFPNDWDSIKPLLRRLLIEKFKIASHTEERPANVYVLTAAKPKLTRSDASERTKCADGPGPDGKDPRVANPSVSRLVHCQNMTMAQFARLLPNLVAGTYERATFQDATGLEGAWDFTLNFSPATAAPVGGRGRDGAADIPSEPTGGLPFNEALVRQLGLKLEQQKRPVPTLVIDHIEQKPSEN
jgi:uncharacterized protein (TIGR03435 family)